MTTEQEELNQVSMSDNADNSGDKSMWEYFVSCLTEKYFCFKGRARRKEYWSFVLFNFLTNLALNFVGTFLATTGGDVTGITVLSVLVTLALLIPGYAVLFRRLHDVNFSGWWTTAPVIAMLATGFMDGYTDAMQHHQSLAAGDSIMPIIALVLVGIAVVMLLIVFVLTFFKSDMKENKYGPVPEGVK